MTSMTEEQQKYFDTLAREIGMVRHYYEFIKTFNEIYKEKYPDQIPNDEKRFGQRILIEFSIVPLFYSIITKISILLERSTRRNRNSINLNKLLNILSECESISDPAPMREKLSRIRDDFIEIINIRNKTIVHKDKNGFQGDEKQIVNLENLKKVGEFLDVVETELECLFIYKDQWEYFMGVILEGGDGKDQAYRLCQYLDDYTKCRNKLRKMSRVDGFVYTYGAPSMLDNPLYKWLQYKGIF